MTLYTLAAWVAYVSLWYMNALPNMREHRTVKQEKIDKAIKAIPVVVGPVMSVFIFG